MAATLELSASPRAATGGMIWPQCELDVTPLFKDVIVIVME